MIESSKNSQRSVACQSTFDRPKPRTPVSTTLETQRNSKSHMALDVARRQTARDALPRRRLAVGGPPQREEPRGLRPTELCARCFCHKLEYLVSSFLRLSDIRSRCAECFGKSHTRDRDITRVRANRRFTDYSQIHCREGHRPAASFERSRSTSGSPRGRVMEWYSLPARTVVIDSELGRFQSNLETIDHSDDSQRSVVFLTTLDRHKASILVSTTLSKINGIPNALVGR